MRRAEFMGRFASGGLPHATAVAGTVMVVSLNSFLVFQAVSMPIAGEDPRMSAPHI
jgi:hypothetical protein